MNFMKYNELDLLWLFESDPICSAKVDEYDGIFNEILVYYYQI